MHSPVNAHESERNTAIWIPSAPQIVSLNVNDGVFRCPCAAHGKYYAG